MEKKQYNDFDKIPGISLEAAEEYKNNMDLLVEKVNNKLFARNDLTELIGDNPISKMYNNHENHANFMYNIFKLNDNDLFYSTIKWVYRTYSNHGFSYDYFLIELNAWMEAVAETIEDEKAEEINKFYSWMIANHQKFIRESQIKDLQQQETRADFSSLYNKFLKCLLQGEHKHCIHTAQQKVETKEDMLLFFEEVIRPTMYKIGELWEEGEITIAEEHLASSIVSRIISSLYSRFINFENDKGKAVISAIANEYHEIGSRIISDSLEMDGWDVEHLGSDTPIESLIDFLAKEKPFLIGLSAALSFNIDNLINTIEKIKANDKLSDIKILVGGKVFNDNPDLWKKTEADAWAKNGREAVAVAESWWKDRCNEYV
ncbi:MAG: cobalamin B12-binding domain-containing protein [bacterium]